MINQLSFEGFPRECVSFLQELSQNNTKLWFEQHRDDYTNFVLTPAQDFVVSLGERLRKISPNVVAIPKIDRSIFRIYRDTRFSRDKSPYKTHVGIWLWEGKRAKNENSGFYFHLDPPTMFLGVGIYIFPKPMLAEYRNSVVHPKHGPALARAVATVRKKGPYEIGGKRYKKTPRSFDPSHKYAEFLLYNGFYANIETPIIKDFYTPKIIDYCFEHFKNMLPIHKWLLAMTQRVKV